MNRILIAAFGMVATTAVLGQSTLIGPATRNGSFEDGVALPWSGVNAVSNNPSFASHGAWFAVLQSPIRTGSWQYLAINPLNGRSLVVSFDARSKASSGFNSLSFFINTQNADGTDVLPSVSWLKTPPLTSSSWTSYLAVFQFPESWNGSSIRLGIDFGGGVSGGPTLTGYLDNVILQQIPEPSALSSLGLGLVFLVLACKKLEPNGT